MPGFCVWGLAVVGEDEAASRGAAGPGKVHLDPGAEPVELLNAPVGDEDVAPDVADQVADTANLTSDPDHAA